MAFFHTTPLGRIINRLTKDTVDVDKNLADFAAFFLRSLLQLLSTVALIGIVTPFALPALLPILLFFYFLYAYFQARAPGTLSLCYAGLLLALGAPCQLRRPCAGTARHASGELLQCWIDSIAAADAMAQCTQWYIDWQRVQLLVLLCRVPAAWDAASACCLALPLYHLGILLGDMCLEGVDVRLEYICTPAALGGAES